jgi:hypothetical protein
MRSLILHLVWAWAISSLLIHLTIGLESRCYASSASRTIRAPRQRVPRPTKPKALVQRLDPSQIVVVATGVFDDTERMSSPGATLMKNGNIFVVWQDLADMAGQQNKGAAGYAMIFNQQIRQIGTKVIYTPTTLKYGLRYNTPIAFPNDKVLLAYCDVGDGGRGKYVLFNSQMRILKGPVVFNDSQTEFIDATRLAGGNAVLIAYHRRQGAHGSGKLKIINSEGEVFLPERTFNSKGLTSNISADLLPDGLVYIMYNCGHTYTKILDPYGNIVRAEKRVPGRVFDPTKICALNNGNIFAVRLTGDCLIFNRAGEIVGDPHPFASENIEQIFLTKLPNGDIFVSTIDKNDKLTCRIMNPEGKVVKGPTTLDQSYAHGGLSQINFPGNRILLIFGGQNPFYTILQ